LPREVRQLSGTTPDEVLVDEGEIRYAVDPWRGQKTGAFLDQRDNRIRVAAYGKGRVLDAFSYQALFALHAAKAATEVVGSTRRATRWRVAAPTPRATPPPTSDSWRANAFDDLREREKRGERSSS
jgi:23S rRNA (cytosine1962-C5)-methyltransferase